MYTTNYNNYRPQVQPQYVWQQPTYQQQTMPMPAQQPIEKVAQPQQPLAIQSIRFLTADEIRAYIVMPNTKEMLIDRTNGLAYIKMADSMGQSSCEKYRFERFIENDNNEPSSANAEPKIDIENYVTKEMAKDFAKTSDLSKISEQIEKIQKQIKINAILSEDNKQSSKGE